MIHLNPNWVLAQAGIVIALGGGVVGTYFALKSVKGPQERAYMNRICNICWVGAVFSVFGLAFIPAPWKYGILIIYVFKVAASMSRWVKRLRELRAEDAGTKK